MWILPLLGYVGLIGGFVFMVLAIASGLYYLSELVEEHTVIAKKTLTRLIYAITAFLTLLWLVDAFPLLLTSLSIASHLVYLQNLRRFPVVKLSDPIFLASCVLVLVNHYVWFRHFSAPPHTYAPPSSSAPYRRWTDDPYVHYPSFTEIASFFGVCVWLVPFALFVSLSAGENVLPTSVGAAAPGAGAGADGAMGHAAGERAGMVKQLVDGVRAWVSEAGELLGVGGAAKGGRRGNRF